MAEQPSYRTSTLSQVWFGATIFYAILAVFCTIGVIWASLPFETAEKVMGWATWLWSNVSSAYLTARIGAKGGTNGTTETRSETPATPTPA